MEAITLTGQHRDSGVVIENGVARTTNSDARAWSVETEGIARGTIETLNTFPGPHPPQTNVVVAENLIGNDGSSSGTINAEFAEINQSGDIVNSICQQGILLAVGDTGSLTNETGCTINNTNTPQSLSDTMPDQFNTTVHYGLRVWSDAEDMPGFPAPAGVGQVAGQNVVDDTINDIANQLGVPPEVVVAGGLATAGVAGGFIVEDQLDLI